MDPHCPPCHRKIIHIDMDAFFASVEQLDNPELRGEAVIVGGPPESRGVVAACSYEARRHGIHSAMPSARAAQLCPTAVFLRPRISRYREISRQVMEIFRSYSELVEPLSLDEAYLDVSNSTLHRGSATLIARSICERIESETGLTASAGVSCNKFLAKVASGHRKPKGLTVILPEEAQSFLDTLPIGAFHGVGQVTEARMRQLGIHTGLDLRQRSRLELVGYFGKAGAFFHDIVRCLDDRPVQPSRVRKSIGSETTLDRDTVDLTEIYAILQALAAAVETALSRNRRSGATITLKVRYHDFTTVTRSATLPQPVADRDAILAQLPRLLRGTEAGRKKVRLLGIAVSKLNEDGRRQPRQLELPFAAPAEPTRTSPQALESF